MEAKKYYEITGKPTEELVEKFNKDNNIFFRFQNPEWELTSESKSWGMIYGSEEEALESAEEDGLTEEEAVLPGKSCMDTLEGLWDWADQFDDSYVILVFEGEDTGVNGHDDEYVAKFQKAVAVWSIEDCYNYLYAENILVGSYPENCQKEELIMKEIGENGIVKEEELAELRGGEIIRLSVKNVKSKEIGWGIEYRYVEEKIIGKLYKNKRLDNGFGLAENLQYQNHKMNDNGAINILQIDNFNNSKWYVFVPEPSERKRLYLDESKIRSINYPYFGTQLPEQVSLFICDDIEYGNIQEIFKYYYVYMHNQRVWECNFKEYLRQIICLKENGIITPTNIFWDLWEGLKIALLIGFKFYNTQTGELVGEFK